ncbi:PPOX class F420-dependent oxidoreductase [Actinomycetospora endophytica]|uniref:PPOX class F420-dependent oxidoreductase n=1 Tax=Actinomycetospora endophytica TaxID=2291215 RepID=A0ABS8P557_9PSEU|nr:PPOX class F420-dependent oxidoreductase [Actinomycetospora endophytica]MCD2193392.1 PPOX class F420-dependent oxidoreductase [Actinomycetospora endophytica]
MASLSDPDIRAFLTHGTRTGKLAWTAKDGRPLVAPIWFQLEGSGADSTLVFNTGADTAKGRALARDPRVSLAVDLEEPPFAFVQVQGSVTLSEDPDELLRTATEIGGRYMGAEKATEFGRRNAVPGELVVRLAPTKVLASLDMTA